jgi:hypothetical protein
MSPLSGNFAAGIAFTHEPIDSERIKFSLKRWTGCAQFLDTSRIYRTDAAAGKAAHGRGNWPFADLDAGWRG